MDKTDGAHNTSGGSSEMDENELAVIRRNRHHCNARSKTAECFAQRLLSLDGGREAMYCDCHLMRLALQGYAGI